MSTGSEAPRRFWKLLPFAAVVVGAAFLVWAIGWHRVSVLVPAGGAEDAAVRETSQAPEPEGPPSTPGAVEAPPGFAPFGLAEPPSTAEPPPGFGQPVAPAPEAAATTAQVPQEPKVEPYSENAVIRETTRGGLDRDADGNVARTWSEEPPKICPT